MGLQWTAKSSARSSLHFLSPLSPNVMPEKNMDLPKRLRRYTNLPVLLDMLVNQKITLLDPASWEDRNDAFFIERYKELQGLKTVLALCFSTKGDTFHHWKVFANEVGGICIEFNTRDFLEDIGRNRGIRYGRVDYQLTRNLKKNPPTKDKLPFVKRKHYVDEGEFRIIFESKSNKYNVKQFNLNLSHIERITLSPWVPKQVSNTVKAVIKSMPDCGDIELIKTGAIDHSEWKKIARDLA
jgi:hypothetical protein